MNAPLLVFFVKQKVFNSIKDEFFGKFFLFFVEILTDPVYNVCLHYSDDVIANQKSIKKNCKKKKYLHCTNFI